MKRITKNILTGLALVLALKSVSTVQAADPSSLGRRTKIAAGAGLLATAYAALWALGESGYYLLINEDGTHLITPYKQKLRDQEKREAEQSRIERRIKRAVTFEKRKRFKNNRELDSHLARHDDRNYTQIFESLEELVSHIYTYIDNNNACLDIFVLHFSGVQTGKRFDEGYSDQLVVSLDAIRALDDRTSELWVNSFEDPDTLPRQAYDLQGETAGRNKATITFHMRESRNSTRSCSVEISATGDENRDLIRILNNTEAN